MKIFLPNSAFLGNIDSFVKGFNGVDTTTLDITANKQWISLHPVALAMVAALGLAYKPTVKCEKLKAKSKHYLERMGLFKFLNISSGMQITEHEPAGRFIPLTQIQDSSGLTQFLNEMVPLLHLEPKQAASIRYIVSELVRNVLEHSASSFGAILCAQYYPKTNTIRIGIVDTGIGIKSSINNSYAAKTDWEALQLALTPGITGTTRKEGGTELNAGAGLFFIKSIASVNRSFFMIYSGNALFKLLKRKGKRVTLHSDPFKDRHSGGDDYPYWQGTVVGVDISLDTTEEFTILLDYIHKTYTTAVRERRQSRFKKAKFI